MKKGDLDREPTISLLVAAALFADIRAPIGTAGEAPNRLGVSSDGRHLATPEGRPLFWLADTAWELLHRLNREHADHYLKRARRAWHSRSECAGRWSSTPAPSTAFDHNLIITIPILCYFGRAVRGRCYLPHGIHRSRGQAAAGQNADGGGGRDQGVGRSDQLLWGD